MTRLIPKILYFRACLALGLTVLSGACSQQEDSTTASVNASAGAASDATSLASAKQSPTRSTVVIKPNEQIVSSVNTLTAKEASIGAVTGFGSVIVEGVKYEDDAALVSLDVDPAQPVQGVLKDIKLGMRVAVKAEGKRAQTFTVSAEVMGRVSSLGADAVVVAGQTVRASADASSPTIFEGLVGMASLAIGDFLEVYGQRDANGDVIATRIERKSAGAANVTRVVGVITALNKSAKTFTIGGLTVAYANATRLVPGADALIEGLKVVVFSTDPVATGVLPARTVKVLAASSDLNGMLRLAGAIRKLDFAARSFMLDGMAVDASAATFVKGTAADLAQGLRVRVSGVYADGKVKAGEVSFQKDLGDAMVDVKGAVTDFATTASFKVRGVPFDATAATIKFINGDASGLVAGVKVRIKGQVSGDTVLPVSIEFLPSETPVSGVAPEAAVSAQAAAPGSFSVQGSIAEIDLEKKTIRLNGNTFSLPVDRAETGLLEQLKVGATVSLEGRVENGQVLTTKVLVRKG